MNVETLYHPLKEVAIQTVYRRILECGEGSRMKGAGSSSSARSGHGALLPATTNCRLPGGLTAFHNLKSAIVRIFSAWGNGLRWRKR